MLWGRDAPRQIYIRCSVSLNASSWPRIPPQVWSIRHPCCITVLLYSSCIACLLSECSFCSTRKSILNKTRIKWLLIVVKLGRQRSQWCSALKSSKSYQCFQNSLWLWLAFKSLWKHSFVIKGRTTDNLMEWLSMSVSDACVDCHCRPFDSLLIQKLILHFENLFAIMRCL